MPVILAIETSAHVGAVALLPDAPHRTVPSWRSFGMTPNCPRGCCPPSNAYSPAGAATWARLQPSLLVPAPFVHRVRTACSHRAVAGLCPGRSRWLAVDSLDALAQQAVNDCAQVTVAPDARMGEVYVASFMRQFEASGAPCNVWQRPRYNTLSSVTLASNALLLGSGAPLVAAAQPDALASVIDRERNRTIENQWAVGVARVATVMLAQGANVDPLAAEPIYVRNNVAQTEVERLAHRRATQAVAA